VDTPPGTRDLTEVNTRLVGCVIMVGGLMRQDLRFALRILARRPAVTVIAVILLAVGIGANTALFSLIQSILLRPLPGVRDPERLVRFLRIESGQTSGNLGYPDYLDYRDQTRLLSGVAAEATTSLSLANEKTERIRGAVVSGNYFSVLGVAPAAGRLITPEDDEVPGGHAVAVISHGIWQRSYAQDPAVIGKIIRLNARNFTIVGVAAADFHGLAQDASTEVWVPMMMQAVAIPRMPAEILRDRTAGWIGIYARLKPGVGIEPARAEVRAIADRLARLYPNTNRGHGADLAGRVGLYPDERKNLGRFFGLLFAAMGMLLLITCCNVANLLLAQAAARRREMAVRLAVGAGRGRIVRQLLVEGLLLCGTATAAGLVLARSGLDLLTKWLLPYMPALQSRPEMDISVLCFAVLLSALTCLLSGLAPALAASRNDMTAAFKDTASASGLRHSRLVGVLVMAQVAISLVLLVGAGLVGKSLGRILQANQGFDANGVLVGSFDLSALAYPPDRARLLFAQLLERMSRLPSVRSASLAKVYPALGGADGRSIFYEGQEPSQEELRRQSTLGIRVQANSVSPSYFRTLSIPLVAGRDFGPQDTSGGPLVCIVSQKLAERLWPHGNPLGKRIAVPSYRGPRRPPVEIIGIAADVKYRSLITEAPLFLYLPLFQNHEVFVSIQLRTTGDPSALALMAAQEATAVDRDLPLYHVQTLNDQVRSLLWQQRAAAGLIASFGAFSLLIASVGLFSVMANAVANRTREIGIRVALGAEPRDVLRIVVRSGMTLAGLGTIVGAAATLAMTRLLSVFLYGVSPTDPATFIWVALVLLGASLTACYYPARAASRVDPLRALHHE
jgi:predicted permease